MRCPQPASRSALDAFGQAYTLAGNRPALDCMESGMVAAPHETQVLDLVVEFVAVLVMDDVSRRDWPVGVFPHSAVFKLEAPVLLALGPAGDGPNKEPVAVLLVPSRRVPALPFVVCAAGL